MCKEVFWKLQIIWNILRQAETVVCPEKVRLMGSEPPQGLQGKFYNFPKKPLNLAFKKMDQGDSVVRRYKDWEVSFSAIQKVFFFNCLYPATAFQLILAFYLDGVMKFKNIVTGDAYFVHFKTCASTYHILSLIL